RAVAEAPPQELDAPARGIVAALRFLPHPARRGADEPPRPRPVEGARERRLVRRKRVEPAGRRERRRARPRRLAAQRDVAHDAVEERPEAAGALLVGLRERTALAEALDEDLLRRVVDLLLQAGPPAPARREVGADRRGVAARELVALRRRAGARGGADHRPAGRGRAVHGLRRRGVAAARAFAPAKPGPPAGRRGVG